MRLCVGSFLCLCLSVCFFACDCLLFVPVFVFVNLSVPVILYLLYFCLSPCLLVNFFGSRLLQNVLTHY